MNTAKGHFDFRTVTGQAIELTETWKNNDNDTEAEANPEIEAWALQTSDDICIDVFD